MDIKKRFKNKAFLTSFIATIVLLLNQLGLEQYIPGNILDITNTVLILLTMLGVVIDPTTEGIGDKYE